MLGAAAGALVVGGAGACVVGGGAGGATAFDVAGAAVAGAAVLRGFAFGFAAAAARVAEEVAVNVGEADASAEALAIGDVLLVGVVFPPPLMSPMMYSTTIKAKMAMPILRCFFIGGPSDGPHCRHDSAPQRRGRPPVARMVREGRDRLPYPIHTLTFRRIDKFAC